jgi:hypothetical protein
VAPATLAVASATPAANLPLIGVTRTDQGVVPLHATVVLALPLTVIVFFPLACSCVRLTFSGIDAGAEQVRVPLSMAAPVLRSRLPLASMVTGW